MSTMSTVGSADETLASGSGVIDGMHALHYRFFEGRDSLHTPTLTRASSRVSAFNEFVIRQLDSGFFRIRFARSSFACAGTTRSAWTTNPVNCITLSTRSSIVSASQVLLATLNLPDRRIRPRRHHMPDQLGRGCLCHPRVGESHVGYADRLLGASDCAGHGRFEEIHR